MVRQTLAALFASFAIQRDAPDWVGGEENSIPTNHTGLAGTVPISRVVIGTQKCVCPMPHSYIFHNTGMSLSRSQVCKGWQVWNYTMPTHLEAMQSLSS